MFAPAGLRSAGSPAGGRADAPRSRGTTAVWVVFAGLGTLLAAYLGYLLLRGSDEFVPLVDGWLIVAIELVAGGLSIAAGIARPARRAPAIAFGLACLMWACGDLVLTFESLGGAEPPVPSPADAFYLGFFPLALAGVALFVRRELGGRRARAGSTPASSGWAPQPSAPASRSAGSSTCCRARRSSQLTNLAYPLGDLLLLGLVAGSV